MAKINITKEDKEEFKKTTNGAKKAIWMIMGMVICFIATLGISLLNIFSDRLPSNMYYFIILFVLLVIVVLGGELIGVYFGALEQYVYHKRNETNKKVLDISEE